MFQSLHLYLGFYSSDLLVNAHLALHTHTHTHTHSLQAVIVTITVLKEQCTFLTVSRLPLERFSWKFMCGSLLEEQCVTAFIWWIFIKIHIYPYIYIRSNSHDFAGNQSVIKGTLLEEQCTFWTVRWLPLEGFSWKFISVNPCIIATNNVSLVVTGE